MTPVPALRSNRNFMLLLFGQASSLIGNYTLKFALSMYVLEQTGSATVFAALLTAATVPTILLSPLGGILADRANRRNMIVTLDTLSGLAVLAACIALAAGHSLFVIGALLTALSVLGAFESPAVQACVPQMLSRRQLLQGNAAVNQIQAAASLITPVLGSLFYTAFGLRPVLCTAVVCFFLTAFLECFIRLPYQGPAERLPAAAVIKKDLSASLYFLGREQPGILKLLLLSALASMFMAGLIAIGFPYLIRTVLCLSAGHYGAAESAMGAAAILGGLAVGLLNHRLPFRRLYLLIVSIGGCLLGAGAVFLLPSASVWARYLVLLAVFCLCQFACSMFSIYALCAIQGRTPVHLTGKIMAYVSTLSMCAQPFGQILYGALFDLFSNSVHWVLLPSGMLLCIIGFASASFFAAFEHEGRSTQS